MTMEKKQPFDSISPIDVTYWKDGSDIRWFHAPVEVGSLSHYLHGFFTSQVVQGFFHQQNVTTSAWKDPESSRKKDSTLS